MDAPNFKDCILLLRKIKRPSYAFEDKEKRLAQELGYIVDTYRDRRAGPHDSSVLRSRGGPVEKLEEARRSTSCAA